MNGINSEFDNLNSMSDTKDFDQSQEREKSILEVPMAYQEFDEIEHELEQHGHSLSEINLFANRLEHSRTVSKTDALALESMLGDNISLPNIRSYTQEATYVNYDVTMESIYDTIKKYSAKVYKSICQFILNAIKYLDEKLVAWLNSEKYNEDPTNQARTETKVESVKEAVDNYDTVVNTVKDKLDTDQKDKRIVRINKELRAALYPKYKELGTLSLGGDINGPILIDEMCEQRFKEFYTFAWSMMRDRDEDLKDLLQYYSRALSDNVDAVVSNSKVIFSGDYDLPPDLLYPNRVFNSVPEQVTNFSVKLTKFKTSPGQIHNEDERFKVLVGEIMNASNTMCSLSSVIDLPTSRMPFEFDLDWLAGLHGTQNKDWLRNISKEYKDIRSRYNNIERNLDKFHDDRKEAMKNVYADWTVIYRMSLTLLNFRKSSEALWSLIESTMNDIAKVLKILGR